LGSARFLRSKASARVFCPGSDSTTREPPQLAFDSRASRGPTGGVRHRHVDALGGRHRTSVMRDCDVRAALHAKVLSEHHDQPDTLVLDELALWYGTARVDVAVVNGRIHGFEIKSDRDTLDRLEGQARVYNNVLDRVTLVVGVRHLKDALRECPDWWGVKIATQGPRRAVHFEELRAPKTNPAVDPVAVAALLWCEELEQILAGVAAIRGYKGKSRDILSRRAAEVIELTALRSAVRVRLKARGNWRVGVPRT
jgi:hypothetical protein